MPSASWSLLDGSTDYSFHADAVATHQIGTSFAVLGQHGSAHRVGVFRTEFEDVTNLHSFEYFKRAGFTLRTTFARFHSAQIKPFINLNVPSDVYSPEMVLVFVRASGHVATVFQRGVGNDMQMALTSFSRRPRQDFPRSRRAVRVSLRDAQTRTAVGAQAVREFGFVQLMIAAQ